MTWPILDTRTDDWRAAREHWLAALSSTPEPEIPTLQPSATLLFDRTPVPSDDPGVDPFLEHVAPILAEVGNDPIVFDEASWSDPAPPDPTVYLDCEVFQNFFCCCLKRADGRRAAFERSHRRNFAPDSLRAALRGATVVTFNGSNYDLVILALALNEATTEELKQASDRIIRTGLRPWEAEREFGIKSLSGLDHVDLVEIPKKASLKTLHARLHGRFLVDLPYDPDDVLSPTGMNVTTLYCMNDLDCTQNVHRSLAGAIALRVDLGSRYRLDLRSKSDAQMGEAIVRRRIEDRTGRRIEKVDPRPSTFRYRVPEWVRFEDDDLRAMVARFAEEDFHADMAGNVTAPAFLRDRVVTIAGVQYNMGIGGLHSREAQRALLSDDGYQLVDVDVASHYPRVILKLGLYPPAAGPEFLNVYRDFTEERVAAKKVAASKTADAAAKAAALSLDRGGKIALNGCFGKFGSSYSFLFLPELLISTTLTGQMSVLLLIERAELAGIPVVSANTDGVVFNCPRDRLSILDEVVARWEADTDFQIERNEYQSLHSSSVNSYFAITNSGKVKRKGPLANPWRDNDVRVMMEKNPQMPILGDAIEALIRDGTPLADTILAATDPRAFVTVVRVTDGAEWRGSKLGRVVRYYWSRRGAPIVYCGSGNKVPNADGAAPMMLMLDELPKDIDLDRYVREATTAAIEYAAIPDGKPKAAVDLLAGLT